MALESKWPVGAKLQAFDVRQVWCNATVIAIRGTGVGREVQVHYQGWNKRWDEWIVERSSRLRARDANGGQISSVTASRERKAIRSGSQGTLCNEVEISAAEVAAAQAEAAEKAELARVAAAEALEAAKAAKAARELADKAARAAAATDDDSTEATVSRQASVSIPNIGAVLEENTVEIPDKGTKRVREGDAPSLGHD